MVTWITGKVLVVIEGDGEEVEDVDDEVDVELLCVVPLLDNLFLMTSICSLGSVLGCRVVGMMVRLSFPSS